MSVLIEIIDVPDSCDVCEFVKELDFGPIGTSQYCGFPGIGTDKFNVFDPVGAGVLSCVLDGLRYDLRSDHASIVPRKTEADGASSAIKVKGKLAGSSIFQRTVIQLFRLRGIDLEESLR